MLHPTSLLKIALLLAALLAWRAAAQSAPSPTTAPASDHVAKPATIETTDGARRAGILASFAGGRITVGDMEDAIGNKLLRTRAEIAKSGGRERFLEQLIRYDVLVLEAERRGYGKHALVIEAAKRAAVDRMLARDAAAAKTPSATGKALSKAERKKREQREKEQQQQAYDALLARLRTEHVPELHPDLVDAIVLAPAAPLDIPAGFPADPKDPRAPPRLVEPDEY